MPASSDRNLLFGILALQMDFITREQLVAGMQAWVLAKDISLAEHLVQADAMKPANRQLLEPLVEAHIRQHGDDPQQSLASISSLDALRGELAALGDPQIDVSMGHIPAKKKKGEDADPYATISVGAASSQGMRFRILRPHAEGGLGRVSVALDGELGREVALKEIKPERADDPDSRGRFTREAEITGGLEHPGIVPVYGLGAYPDGRPFYAMRFIRGKSLKEAIEKFHERRAASGGRQPPDTSSKKLSLTEENLELRKLLQRLIDVCEAMDYAHSRGVLHRDLKPGNIMLGKYGETLVVDWGLAKPLGKAAGDSAHGNPETVSTVGMSSIRELPLEPQTGSSESTFQGSALGTPAFMSPEQALGRLDLLGPASDVFSLGAILYQVLTGQPPYAAPTKEEVLRKAQVADYSLPRTLRRSIPAPLEAICLKALAPLSSNRYSSCRALAQDLESFLADEPITARRETISGRISRLARRHRSWVQAATGALVLMTFGAILALIIVNGYRREAIEMAVKNKSLAEELDGKNSELKDKSLLQQIELARAPVHWQGWFERAWSLVSDASRIRANVELRSEAVATLAHFDTQVEKDVRHQPASSVAFSLKGGQLLVGGVAGTRHYEARGAELYDRTYLQLLSSPPAGYAIVGFRDKSPVQIVSRKDSKLELWDIGANKAIREFRFSEGPERVEVSELTKNDHGAPLAAMSANAKRIAAAAKRTDGTEVVSVWDGESGEQQFSQELSASALAFSTDGEMLAVGNPRGDVAVWSFLDGKKLQSFQATRGGINCLAFSGDDRRLAIGGTDGNLAIWDWQVPIAMANCRGSEYDVYAVAFSPDGMTLASGGRNRGFLWDVATGRPLLQLHTGDHVTGLAFSPDGRRLACSNLGGEGEGGVYVWALDEDRGIQTLRGLDTQVVQLWFSEDGKSLAALSQNWRIGVWRLATPQTPLRLLHVFDAPRGALADNAGLAFSRDGSQIAFSTSGETPGKALMWDLKTGEIANEWPLPPGLQDALAFHPSGKLLLFRVETRDKEPGPFSYAPPDKHPRVVRVRELDRLRREPREPFPAISVFPWQVFPVLTPRDGAFFVMRGKSAAADSMRTVNALDSLTGKELWAHKWDTAITLALDPLGKVLSVAGSDKSSFYDPRSGEELLPTVPPGVIGIGDKGRWLVREQKVRGGISLFRRGTSEAKVDLSLDQTGWGARFSDDGNLLAVGHPDGSVSVHNLSAIQKRLTEVGLEW